MQHSRIKMWRAGPWLTLDISFGMWKYWISSFHIETKSGVTYLRSDFLSSTSQTLEARLHEMGLDHTLNVSQPNTDSLKNLHGHQTRTGVIGGRLDDKLKTYFNDKKPILEKVRETCERESILELLLYLLADWEWVIHDIEERKDLAIQISRRYSNYDNMMKGSRNHFS